MRIFIAYGYGEHPAIGVPWHGARRGNHVESIADENGFRRSEQRPRS